MRVAISGTHGIGKTTLVDALCAHLPGHVMVDEPYYLLEEQGYEFDFPPSPEDYRAMLAYSVRSMRSPSPSRVVFDRTPLDYFAYLAANGADPAQEADVSTLRPAFATLDLLVIAVITPESERILPAAELSGLRLRMNDALLELVYDDPLDAWNDTPVLELSGPLDDRLEAILDVLKPGSAGAGAAPTRFGAEGPWSG
ncbi:AAA family ATPase [Micromonospora sp. SCSIO 07396]